MKFLIEIIARINVWFDDVSEDVQKRMFEIKDERRK